jgi:hypothetical protein
MMRNAILAILVLGLFSCAAEGPPAANFSAGDEGGTMVLDFASIEAPLDMNKVKSFRIRVYPSTPMAADDETLFDSMASYGCFPAKGTEIIIENIKEGDGRFVFYEGFSDSQCSTPEVVGIRGGIDIQKTTDLEETASQVVCSEDADCTGVHPRATCDCAHEVSGSGTKQPLCKAGSTGTCTVTPPTFVMLLQVGRFNEYPVAGDDLQSAAKAESCDSDADCAAIHMNAVCDEEVGRCLIRGLDPLSPATPRAYHTATVLDSGKILLAGGFTHRKANGDFYADGPFLEVFDPFSGLFEPAPEFAQFAGNRVAMHQAVHLGGDKVAMVGGVTEAALEVLVDGESELGVTIPFGLSDDCNDDDCANVSRYVTIVNVAGEGAVEKNPTDMRLVFHQAANMVHGGANKLLVTGGLAVDPDMPTVELFDRYLLCTLGNGTGATCAVSSTDETLVAPRAGHADLCLVPDGNGPGCQEYMLFGGAITDGASGEVFSSSESVFNAALEFSDPTKTGLIGVLLSELVRVDGDGAVPNMFSFGGTTAVSDPEPLNDKFRLRIYPPVTGPAPEQVRVDLQSGNLTVAQVDLSDLGGDNSKTFRIFHTSTVMDDGSVLVAGGLDAENKASKNVMFFEDPNTDALTFSGETTMRQRRFGHTATVITEGLLEGGVLIIGGFTVDSETGLVDFAPPAEIFLPAP